MANKDILSNKALEEMSDNERYHKNVLYITPVQQDNIRNKTILFAGVGLGSVVAEAALRVGFEKFIFIDGDKVEISNLNRQNYEEGDIGKYKVEAIAERMRLINSEVKIETHSIFLDPENISSFLDKCDIAINAIDFDTLQTPFVFDEICQKKGIPVIHPLNFGWAGAAFLMTPESQQIFNVPRNDGRFELILIENMINYFKHRNDLNLTWFEDFLKSYQKHSAKITPPQLAVGSYLTSAIVANILFCLVNNLEVKTFPDPYFLSAR